MLKVSKVALSVVSLALFGACSDSSSSSGSSVTDSFPAGMAVASPTATGTVSSAMLGLSVLGASVNRISSHVELEAEGTLVEKVEAINEILEANQASDCQISLPVFGSMGDPLCYGPQLDYQDHPDGMGGDGQFPGGDLGIWTEAFDGEACTAAKINALIQSAASKVDHVMLSTASMVCLLKRADIALPSEDGDEVDLASLLNTAVQVNNPDITISAAGLENLADVTDTDDESRDVYQFSIELTDDTGPNTITVTAFMKHMPTSSNNSTYKGKIWAKLVGVPNSTDAFAFSISYEKASSSSLKYKMLSANYQTVDGSTVYFEANGDLAVDGDWDGSMSQAILNLDPETGLGSFSYSWQAGRGDDKARIFNGFTDLTGGCGFFGFGDNFNTSTGVASDNVIDGFICNWAGPGGDHSMSTSADLAQKQCMLVDETTGVFEVDPSRNNITFAPTVSCDGDGTMTVKLTTESTYTLAPANNDLVDLNSDVDFADYSAPTAPDLPEDF